MALAWFNMNRTRTRSDGEALERLEQSVDACMARDIPPLRKQIHSLRRRFQRNQPIDRGIRKLSDCIERSRRSVSRRRDALPVPKYPLALPVVEKREQILEELWGQNDYFLGRSMDVFISRLRKYLQAEPSISLETKRGVGFILKTSSHTPV